MLNDQDATWAMNYFVEYFGQYERIDQYLREQKLEQVKSFPYQLPGVADEDEFFNNFDLHPQDMEFSIKEPNGQIFDRMLNKTSSHTNMSSIPGKSIRLEVKEINTNTVVGFIRLGSPVINSKPRNVYLGRPLATTDLQEMGRFNASVIMGFVLVPTQPFGYDYLGGKLLAAICCSHYVRDFINRKYNANMCLFETTSLYGSSKASSQYDGMKPYLRFKGLTDSHFLPLLHGEAFKKMNKWFIERNNDEPLVDPEASSRKLKTQTKMVSVIKESLKRHNSNLYEKFGKFVNKTRDLTERKRFYMSDYGYENVPQYLKRETDELKPGFHYDKFKLENAINWWKKIAGKRFNKLKQENRLRKELEIWHQDAEIQIIR
tara:strand:- start:38 stop:1162 length:1125 start_codon:yes stop_codon:yes gene_type:complete